MEDDDTIEECPVCGETHWSSDLAEHVADRHIQTEEEGRELT